MNDLQVVHLEAHTLLHQLFLFKFLVEADFVVNQNRYLLIQIAHARLHRFQHQLLFFVQQSQLGDLSRLFVQIFSENFLPLFGEFFKAFFVDYTKKDKKVKLKLFLMAFHHRGSMRYLR